MFLDPPCPGLLLKVMARTRLNTPFMLSMPRLTVSLVDFFFLFSDDICKDAKKESGCMDDDSRVDSFLFKLKKKHLGCKKRSGEGSTQVKSQK